MNHPPQPNTCPQCSAVLPADAPQGLCPACLLAAVALPTEAGTAAPAKAPAPTREQVATAFPQLEILELIGAGGMGYVFKARQPKLDRLVALKLLPQHLGADAAFAGRFEREGRVLARLSHPNIVTVHDFGFARAGDWQSPFPSPRPPTDGDYKSPALPLSPDAQPETPNSQPGTAKPGFYYLLMEFVDGVNLRQAMRAGRFTPVQALEVVPKICEALQFAHEQGILHRDIKPENILLDAKGRVKLVDFGIAKLVDDGRAELPPGLDAEAAQQRGPTTLTSATAALGTPSYMAPEQRDHPAEVDHRADIYSLGVVFYEMLTGELPVGKFAPPSAKSASDPRVDEVVLRALEQQRERRQQSAGEVKTQVETIASSPGSSRREAAPIISPESSDSAAARALSPVVRWSFLAVIIFLFVSGCYAAWKTMSVIGRGEIGLNLGVLLLPAAIGLHRRRAGWRICALAFLWFGAVFAVITAASQLTHPHEPVIRLGGTPMSAGATWWQSALLAAGFWWLARVLSQQQIRAQFATARPKSGWGEWAVLLAALLVAYAGSHVFPPRPASAVTHFGCVSVGVSNNVVIVDVNTEVWLKSVALRAELTGPRLSSATEAAARELIPAFSGTFVHPTPHTSNAPSRILPTGRHTWRIGFVLPSAALAQEAERNLRRIGPLRAEPGRASAGTLFEVRQPDGVAYRASLQVATTNHFAQATPAKPVPDLSAKQITFTDFKNLSGSVWLNAKPTLGPGESFQAWLVLPDGTRELAMCNENVFSHGGRETGISGWGWQFQAPFSSNRTDEVVTQLRERWYGKNLACPPGQPVTVFTLTNEAGLKISGEVQFNRTTTDPAQPAVAAVMARSQMPFGSMLRFTSTVPDGHSLHVRATGTETHAAHPVLSRSASKYSTDAHCSWHWTDYEFTGMQSAAARQMQALFDKGPLLVTNGQPRTLFSVTNANGKIYSGQFELRGPGFVPPPAPAVKPRSPSLPQPSVPAGPPKPSTPEGLALMAQLREHYNRATNLVVEGHTVTTMLRTNQPAFVTTNRFELKLGRPGLYQVRWTSSPVGTHVHTGAAWSDGESHWFWMNGSAPVAQANRELALGGGVGVSQNVTGWLPGLFFGKASWVEVLGDLKVEPDAVIEGEACTVLVGLSRNNPTRLWISKRDFLLRQAEHVNTITAEPGGMVPSGSLPAGSSIRTVQTYRRVLTGQNLTPSDFKFTPPGTK